jgi:hypothetical protein
MYNLGLFPQVACGFDWSASSSALNVFSGSGWIFSRAKSRALHFSGSLCFCYLLAVKTIDRKIDPVKTIAGGLATRHPSMSKTNAGVLHRRYQECQENYTGPFVFPGFSFLKIAY